MQLQSSLAHVRMVNSEENYMQIAFYMTSQEINEKHQFIGFEVLVHF